MFSTFQARLFYQAVAGLVDETQWRYFMLLLASTSAFGFAEIESTSDLGSVALTLYPAPHAPPLRSWQDALLAEQARLSVMRDIAEKRERVSQQGPRRASSAALRELLARHVTEPEHEARLSRLMRLLRVKGIPLERERDRELGIA